MAKHYADVRIEVTVMFDDEGGDDLHELAIEAAIDKIRTYHPAMWDSIEIVGPIRDTEAK